MQLNTSMDLEKSFGPIYARGLLRRGQSAFAVLAVNRQELQSSIDSSLTFGILWLDVCRQAHAGKMVVGGLKLIVPAKCSELVRARMAHLNPSAAKWQLYELDERSDEITEVEVFDRGNISARLIRCADESEIERRFAEPIALVRTLMPEAETAQLSSAEVAFRCHGLEFARARLTAKPGNFRSEPKLCLVWARRKEFWPARISRIWNGWFAALERRATPKVHATIVSGVCIRSVGWSRWWSKIFAR